LPGSPKRIVPVDPETADVMEHVTDLFRAKFGRDPGPGDHLFFDPSSDVPRRMSDEQFAGLEGFMLKMLAEAGLSPEHLYAVKKTGRIVTRENMQYLTPEDIAEWNAAVQEYEAQSKAKQ
jgi:hypothetical protein